MKKLLKTLKRLLSRNPHHSTMKELKKVSSVFAIVSDLNRRGLIFFHVKNQTLLIEESLAIVQLQQGREGFIQFLENVAAWQNYRIARDAYDNRRLELEAQAVRKAKQDNGTLGKADIQRIRQEAREDLSEISMDELKCIREFDIMVIRANAQSVDKATEENGQLLALGHYDGHRVDMAMYEDIKSNLSPATL